MSSVLLHGEFCLYNQVIESEVIVVWRPHGNAIDYRTRHNHTQRRTEGFACQISAIVDSYMQLMFKMGDDALTKSYVPPPQAIVQGLYKIKVLDMFSEFSFFSSAFAY